MEHNYPKELNEHLQVYRVETILAVGRMCRVGRMSEETALDFLGVMEEDRRSTDADLLHGDTNG